MGTANAPAAGWYPDPADATRLRLWDGSSWTEHTTPAHGRQATPHARSVTEREAHAPAPGTNAGAASPGFPEPPSRSRGGLFGSKKALESELQELRRTVDAFGYAEREALQFIEPVLARYVPDVEADVAAQHRTVGAAVGGVRRLLDRLAAMAEPPPGELLTLYRSYQRLTATNLVHLDHEETHVMPALWLAAPPDALTDVLARFRAAHPEAADLYRRWPDALTPTERHLLGAA